MEASILKSVKKVLGLDPDYDAFDEDVIMAINNAFMTLQQLGVGPAIGFMISGPDETWSDFLGTSLETNLQGVRSYVYQKARLVFDPPSSSFGLESLKAQVQELEWRLNVQVDKTPPVDTVVNVDPTSSVLGDYDD